MAFHCPEVGRVTTGPYASSRGDPFGAFFIRSPDPRERAPLKVIADDGSQSGWEHASVSLPHRCPTWAEMARIKDLFWDDADAVLQFHPPRAEYVDLHPYCLHLWRPVGGEFPRPPRALV